MLGSITRLAARRRSRAGSRRRQARPPPRSLRRDSASAQWPVLPPRRRMEEKPSQVGSGLELRWGARITGPPSPARGHSPSSRHSNLKFFLMGFLEYYAQSKLVGGPGR
jgi:hypothetical protein